MYMYTSFHPSPSYLCVFISNIYIYIYINQFSFFLLTFLFSLSFSFLSFSLPLLFLFGSNDKLYCLMGRKGKSCVVGVILRSLPYMRVPLVVRGRSYEISSHFIGCNCTHYSICSSASWYYVLCWKNRKIIFTLPLQKLRTKSAQWFNSSWTCKKIKEWFTIIKVRFLSKTINSLMSFFFSSPSFS